MRFIGIDVHRDFCEVCVLDRASGEEQRRGVATRPAELEVFASELDRADVVALETSSPATAVARVLEPHAGRVVVIDPRGLVRAGARAKTDSTRRAHAGAVARGRGVDRDLDAGRGDACAAAAGLATRRRGAGADAAQE